ncbi:MAG TPA: aldo/keto reductase [Solirubrobacteraceae bacterium]
MEYRQLGTSGLRISALTMGTMSFGGEGSFKSVGNTDVAGAKRQIGMCLDAGVNLIDTADMYSNGRSAEPAVRRRRGPGTTGGGHWPPGPPSTRR